MNGWLQRNVVRIVWNFLIDFSLIIMVYTEQMNMQEFMGD